MSGSIRRISLNSLDWGDETFRSSLGRDVGPLRESIEMVGLICPPRVQRRGERFRLVSGFLRAEALRIADVHSTEVEEVGEGMLEDRLLMEALHENRFTRGFTWAERALVLDRVVRIWGRPRSWILQNIMPAMGMHASPRLLDDHLAVASLCTPARDALLARGASLANALRLAQWPADDQETMIPFLEGLHLGESLLREFLDMLREIALQEKCSLSMFLASPEIREILEDPNQDRPQRAQTLRAYLRRKRYPRLVSMERAFRKARATLRFPPDLSIEPKPFFEESGVRVSFRAPTQREFKEMIMRLREACEKEDALRALFRATEDLPP